MHGQVFVMVKKWINIVPDDYLYWSDGSTWMADQGTFGALGRINRYSIEDKINTVLFEVPDSQLMDILLDGPLLYYLDWRNT